MVRQAITLLLNHPESAALLNGLEQLDGIKQPGVPLLVELIHDLRERPAKNKAVVIERWRDRPEGVHLNKLAAADSPLEDAGAAAQDLQKALQSIVNEWGVAPRIAELIQKQRVLGLSNRELIELNELLKVRGSHATTSPKPARKT